MAIIDGFTSSFKREILEAGHDLRTDVLMIALYDSTASLGPSTTVYTTTGEVTGTAYVAGGATLTVTAPSITGTTAIVDLADVTWSTATITARGALIYNSTQANKAIRVIDFGLDRIKIAADFVVTFPAADELTAVIRIV
jgi:hypothetical protein